MKQNYEGINKRFIQKNFLFLDVLTEIAMNLAHLHYYPQSDSVLTRNNIIEFANDFCQKHQNTDWEAEGAPDFIMEVDLFTDKIFIDWVNEDVLENDRDYDKDEQKALGEIVRNLQMKQPEVKEN